MTNHTPTPRTAAEVEVVHQGGLIAPGDGFVHHTGECEMVSADFARTLERELAEANLRFAKAETERDELRVLARKALHWGPAEGDWSLQLEERNALARALGTENPHGE